MQIQLNWTISPEESKKALINLIKFMNETKNKFGQKTLIMDEINPEMIAIAVTENETHN